MNTKCFSNKLNDFRFLNKSVYFKLANKIYFLGENNAQQLDKNIIPKSLSSFVSILDLNEYRKKLMNYFIENLTLDKINLINKIIKIYTLLQLRYNYVNTGKCCSILIIDYITTKEIGVDFYDVTKSYLNCQEAHDLYIYLFTRTKNNSKFSYFYNLFLVCQKIQQFIYKNGKKNVDLIKTRFN